MSDVIGAFIPIVMFLVAGLVWITIIYFKSREKQMLIEKGLSPEEIKLFFETNRKKDNSFLLTKIGIISIFFGLGIGLGMHFQELYDQEYWTVLFIFTFTGVGFITANLLGRKLEKNY
ncbi:MAG: DUF6249 domain-containing protein [Ignavibacteriales bacterium]